jgi:hypothetical protein
MNVTLFRPYKAQQAFIDKFVLTDDLFGVLVAPRGSGKTLAAINFALFWALQKKNQRVGWCSPTFSQAKSVLDQIVSAAPDLVESSNRQEAVITLINGSTIKFLSSDSADNIRGFRFTHLILDECAYIKQSVINTILLPTLNPNGKKCLLVSTPAGKNHFFSWYMKEDTISHRITLEECPYISQTLLDEAKSSLPADIYAQEYLAQFVDSANDVFKNIEQVAYVGEYREGGDVYIGVDVGLSNDASVLTCISPIGRVVKMVTLTNTDITTVATRFTTELQSYNVIGGNIEINGVGRGVYDLMRNKFRRVKGFTTNANNKTEMVRKLIHDIETMTIELPSETLCPALHREFATYTYKLSPTGKLSFSHISGEHDDHIDSLMMANYARVTFMERKPIRVSGHRNPAVEFGRPR